MCGTAGGVGSAGRVDVAGDDRRQHDRDSVVHYREIDQTADQLLHRVARRQRPTHRQVPSAHRPTVADTLQKISVYPPLFRRRTRASYVYNGCLAWYNVVLTPRVHSSVKLVSIPLATRATVG